MIRAVGKGHHAVANYAVSHAYRHASAVALKRQPGGGATYVGNEKAPELHETYLITDAASSDGAPAEYKATNMEAHAILDNADTTEEPHFVVLAWSTLNEPTDPVALMSQTYRRVSPRLSIENGEQFQ